MAYTPPALPYFGPVFHTTKGNNLPIIRIVIHGTVGADAKGAQGTAKYFQTAASGGSAQYITDSDEAIQCARDSVICWHAPPNPNSLGIEMCCSLSNRGKGHWARADHIAMMHVTAKLTAQKCLQYDVPIRKLTVAQVKAGERGICSHDAVSKAFRQSDHWDPGEYFPWVAFIAMVRAEANIINGQVGDQPMAASEVKAILDALAAYESSAGAEGQRYAALQNTLNGVAGRLVALDAQDDQRSELAGQRWAQTQDAVATVQKDVVELKATVKALVDKLVVAPPVPTPAPPAPTPTPAPVPVPPAPSTPPKA